VTLLELVTLTATPPHRQHRASGKALAPPHGPAGQRHSGAQRGPAHAQRRKVLRLVLSVELVALAALLELLELLERL
jgi:hypothetical protein